MKLQLIIYVHFAKMDKKNCKPVKINMSCQKCISTKSNNLDVITLNHTAHFRTKHSITLFKSIYSNRIS